MVPRLRNSPWIYTGVLIQGNSIGILFNALLVELLTIFDSFFTNTTSDYIEVVSQEWWGATK